jgi:hypothetical protein
MLYIILAKWLLRYVKEKVGKEVSCPTPVLVVAGFETFCSLGEAYDSMRLCCHVRVRKCTNICYSIS